MGHCFIYIIFHKTTRCYVNNVFFLRILYRNNIVLEEKWISYDTIILDEKKYRKQPNVHN